MKETTVLTTGNFTKLLLSCFIAGWYNTQGRFRVLTLQDTSGKARHKLIVRCAVPQSHGFSPHPCVTPRHVAFQMAEVLLPAEGALRPWWCVWPSPIWGRFWGWLLRTSRQPGALRQPWCQDGKIPCQPSGFTSAAVCLRSAIRKQIHVS